jgi:hypothetical protein
MGPCRLHVIFMPCGDMSCWVRGLHRGWDLHGFFQVRPGGWVRVQYPLGQSGPRLGRHRQTGDVLVGKSLRGTI